MLPENRHESIMVDGREELSDIKSDNASLETSSPELLALLHVVRRSPPESAGLRFSPPESGGLWRTNRTKPD